jgi:hypothetical protein
VAGDIVWDVRTTFGLNGLRTDYSQLDRVNDLVGDAMPPGALPFAEHWGGEDMLLYAVKGRAVSSWATTRRRRTRSSDQRWLLWCVSRAGDAAAAQSVSPRGRGAGAPAGQLD